MRYIFLAVFFVMSVGACAQKSEEFDSNSHDAAVCSSSFYSPLPDSALHIDVPFHFLNDRIYTKANGEVRRGIELEYLEGNVASTLESVTASMKAAGYNLKGQGALDEKGVVRQTYLKGEGTGIFVAIFPSAGKNPANPGAKGVLRLSWALPSAESVR